MGNGHIFNCLNDNLELDLVLTMAGIAKLACFVVEHRQSMFFDLCRIH